MQERAGRVAVALALGALTLSASDGALAAGAMIKTQAPGYYRLMLGRFEVTALLDGTMVLPMTDVLTDITPAEARRYLAREFLHDPVETSVNAFLVNTGSKLVLIDAGAGGLMDSGTGKLLESLTASGYRPEQVDEIYITHMHGDHISGITTDGRRVFPNATVRAARLEADYWLDPAHLAAASADDKENFQHAQQTFAPYQQAGAFSPFEDGAQLVPGVRAVATHGHTAGHTSYLIESENKKMMVLGDLLHAGALQFPKPAVTIKYDQDRRAARAQRERVFHDAAAGGYWIAAAHLAFPGIGHVRHEGSGYAFVPVNYGLPH
jgi:glyoxylase-like metal-dependent hydrolase (beta-lactamase superfamily II)